MMKKSTAFLLLILCGEICFADSEGKSKEGSWLHPQQILGGYWLSSPRIFSKYQAAQRAIWKHAPKEYLFRRIGSEYEVGGNHFSVDAIVGDHDNGYRRVMVDFEWTESLEWRVRSKRVEDVETSLAEDAYILIRKHLLEARHGQRAAVAPGDVSQWECLHEKDRKGIVVQGYQFGYPSHDRRWKDDYLKIIKVLTGVDRMN